MDEDYVEEDVAWPSSGTARKQCRLCVVGAAAAAATAARPRDLVGALVAARVARAWAVRWRLLRVAALVGPRLRSFRRPALLLIAISLCFTCAVSSPSAPDGRPSSPPPRRPRAHKATVVSSESARYVRRGASARAGAVRAAGPPLAPLYVWSRTSRRSCRRSYSKWVLYDGVGSVSVWSAKIACAIS